MGEATIETLVQRLERVEQKNLRLKWLMTLVFVAVFAVLAADQQGYITHRRAVVAEEFTVVGSNGTVVAQLGQSGLAINDINGKSFFNLAIGGELAELRFVGFKSGGIGFYGSDGKTGGSLWILEKRADLVLRGEAGSVSISTGQLPSQEYLGFRSFVSLADQNGKVVWKAP